ncbi:hypothetical protein L083_2117 [Actinoplanes sp. N902-109]|nr:hypothetical protein L083_2117 [Actinoplanes sp. N902-109]
MLAARCLRGGRSPVGTFPTWFRNVFSRRAMVLTAIPSDHRSRWLPGRSCTITSLTAHCVPSFAR